MNEPMPGHLGRECGKPLLRPGNTNCGGCGMSIGLQMLRRALGTHQIQLVIPACCAAVAAGSYPYSAIGAPVVLSTFASSAAVASGLANIARLNGEPTRVVAWAGDGGSYDIGLATLSAAAERNEDILYICYDNEIYGNTGGQRSSSTPVGAVTTTGGGKVEQKKDLLAIMAAHGIPYAASVSVAHPEDCLRKLRTALDTQGFRFLHLLAPCPTGWKSEPAQGVELVRLAVQCGLFPVVEIRDGDQLQINVEPDFSATALERYLGLQGRFRKAALDPGQLQTAIARHWRGLRLKAGASAQSAATT